MKKGIPTSNGCSKDPRNVLYKRLLCIEKLLVQQIEFIYKKVRLI